MYGYNLLLAEVNIFLQRLATVFLFFSLHCIPLPKVTASQPTLLLAWFIVL